MGAFRYLRPQPGASGPEVPKGLLWSWPSWALPWLNALAEGVGDEMSGWGACLPSAVGSCLGLNTHLRGR